jgi:hypothetical protein
MLTRRRQRELLGMIHFEIVGVEVGFDGSPNRSGAGIDGVFGGDFPFAPCSQQS